MGNVGLAELRADRWSDRNILITGAAGLLGGAVARQLAPSNAKLIGLDVAWERAPEGEAPRDLQRIAGDVRETARLKQLLGDLRVDTVIHLAAQTLVGPAIRDPTDTFSNNIEGSWSVLEACRTVGGVASIVVASSDKAYGDWSGRPYREDMALRARHPYDVSKAASDLIAQSYAATYAMPVGVSRCGNLYGGGDLNWSRIVPGTIRSILLGERPVIRSDGTPIRDYLHVSDAAAGVLMLADALRGPSELHGQAFNFAAGVRLATIDVVRRILLLMKSELEPDVRDDASYEIQEQRLSAARAKRVLRWRPRTSLDDGLTEAIAWYRHHLAAVA